MISRIYQKRSYRPYLDILLIMSSSQVLDSSVKLLKDALAKRPEGDHLVWDKDDDPALDFVVACANLRATIFNIPNKSRFDVKSMAGNVIQYLTIL